MNTTDPLDDYLTRLPKERPSPDLTVRIIAAVAHRQRTRAMWRRMGALTLISALVGVALVLASWPHVADSLGPALSAIETYNLAPAFNTLVAAPFETVATWLDTGLTWQAAQAEGIGIVFTLGIALLSVAAFGGLMQLLNAGSPGQYSR